MAGSYPDAPGRRMVYDRDGTVVLFLQNSATTVVDELSTGEKQQINRDDAAGDYNISAMQSLDTWMCFLFPELRDITHYYVAVTTGAGTGSISPGNLQWSADTSNGIDGTWTNAANPFQWDTSQTTPNLRNNIDAVSISGAKAIRFFADNSGGQRTIHWQAIHLYGGPASGQNPDRLRLWHPTLDQEIGGAYFDWGDVARSTSADRTFRVKNNSAALTANGIVVSLSALTDTTPSVPGQHLLSQDGVNFAATQNIGVLSPGAISPVLTLRRVTPSNAGLSLWWARVAAVATTWT